MKKTKKVSALIVSVALLVGGTSAFAQYPEPVTDGEGTTVYGNVGDSSLCPGYPSKINGVGGDGVYQQKWITKLKGKDAVKDYSNPDKRFTVGGKNFILLDKDEEGNYFVIADDLYGKKSFANISIDPENMQPWHEFMYNGGFLFDTENELSIAKWLNEDFLTDGNTTSGVTYKLPDAIINNLVEKDYWVEGGNLINDTYYYKQLGEEAPIFESVPSYKVTQKVSLLSATEYHTYWEDISPLIYNGDNTLEGWDANAWWLRTPNNINLTGGSSGDGKDQLGIYISAGYSNGTGMRSSSATYNALGVRPVFWLESDFFATNRLDMIDPDASVIVDEIKTCDPKDLVAVGMYNEDELASIGLYFSDAEKVSDVHLIGEPIVGNTITAGYVSDTGSGDVSWLHSDTENGEYTVVDYGSELMLKNEHIGYMKICVTPANSLSDVLIPMYSPAFEVEAPDKYPYTEANHDFPDDTETYPVYNSVKDSFTIDTSSATDEFIILDKFYGEDGKPQLFLYASHAVPNSVSWAIGVPGATNENASQKYDPTLEGSLAYRIANNSISASSTLDSAFWNSLEEHNWLTEAGLDDVCPDSYSVTAKAALLSYSEYLKYSKKIGSSGLNSAEDVYDNAIDGGNVYFRTPAATRHETGAQQVIRLTTNSAKTMTRLSLTQNLASWSIGVRPAMYLDMDYFVNNKIDLQATASDSALYEQLKEHFSREDLIEIYGDDVDSFGLASEYDMPAVSALTINGTLAVGATLSADYTLDRAEGATEYQWYAMGASGVYEPIEGATQKSYKLTDDELGKEILVAVRPADADGVQGIIATAYTAEVVRNGVETSVTPSVEMTGTSINASFEINAVDPIDNACVIIAVYNEGGAMVDYKLEQDVNISAGTDTYEFTFENYNEAGVKCKAMIWKSLESLEPLGTYAEASVL